MTNDRELMRQAQPDPFNRLVRIMGTFDLSTGHADNWNDLLDSLESELRDVLGYYRETFKVEQECSTHPDAPHGFNRDASHNLGRYVCDCEGWGPPNVSQEPQTMSEKSDDVAQETQPEQEPVAWVLHRELFWPYEYEVISENGDNAIPLYTVPPKREWVGLTDDELSDVLGDVFGNIFLAPKKSLSLARAIEAKLKEKNS